LSKLRNTLNVAIVGNPNSGKTTLFNILTGLHFKTGNFPGVTVDKKIGKFSIGKDVTIRLIDLPGTYSLHPNSPEEAVNLNYFIGKEERDSADVILYVADSTALDKQLLLLHQLLELELPIVLALNMSDTAKKYGVQIDINNFESTFGIRAVAVSARTGEGIETLKNTIVTVATHPTDRIKDHTSWYKPELEPLIEEVKRRVGIENSYLALLIAEHNNYVLNQWLKEEDRNSIRLLLAEAGYRPLSRQIEETMNRFKIIEPFVEQHVKQKFDHLDITGKMDSFLTHRFFGPVIFLIITFIMFQAVFSLAAIPMEWIDKGFVQIGFYLEQVLPEGNITKLFTEGILAGINGVLMFVPQIGIMFFFIVLLEESGYMARVVFMFDRVMRIFGMNGRSLVSLISSSACAIPAILSTRTIKNRKQRLITLFVAPFISCSARIPVYTMLLALVVPNVYIWKFIHLQGLAFFGLYIIGAGMALFIAFLMKWLIKKEERGYLMIQLPSYRMPHWRSVANEVKDKVSSFIWTAGRIILVISVLLWLAANTSTSGTLKGVERKYTTIAHQQGLDAKATQILVASKKLEHSFAGKFGKGIEPIIRPLGYDWKIGIALLTSFAAREVFVGTLSTIYSVEDESQHKGLRKKIQEAIDIKTGQKIFNRATTLSLLVFYILAMQCMSTLAVVKKETQTWIWPIIQFVVMTGLAYFFAWITYSFFK